MEALLSVVLLAVIVFGSVVFFGAPYLPTLDKQTQEALDMLDLKKGQRLLELGSGDGRVLLAAARRGIYSTGYELNPVLVVVSKVMTWRYRKFISVRWANFWTTEWPEADGIYVFLLQKYMKKLDTKVVQEIGKTGKVRLVAYAFTIPRRKPKKQIGGLSLYEYR